ncbi:MAG: M20/M25/M40 family metallo-hydrolase [Verrucomicrobia bacterium]|nr:M20/M25/M40 family metallo-hydrolase [Verrucomicrobiota bacterium]MCH8527028.1 M20/M25/M40 family metallo-hydrolase [Kiritimatiellia bacterium]
MPLPPLHQLLRDLIRVPSVNPAHTSDPAIRGERRMADALQTLFTERGLVTERIDTPDPERPAVLGRADAPVPKQTLMFEVHLDTVGIDNMTLPPFEGILRDNRMYGRGACDMKGATAALLYALTPERIRALNARGVSLLIVGAPDEECGTKGAETLAASGVRADHAVILEPTRCRPVVAHKGANWYDIVLRGRSGHGSQPEAGISTHEALARILPEILRAHKALQQMHSHPLLGVSSLNIGRISGGHTYNIIPDHTLIQLDRRVIPTEDPALFEQAVQHILDELIREGRLLSGTVTRVNQTAAFATNPGDTLPQSLLDAVESVTGQRPACEGTSWVSDAAPFSTVCGQTLVFGPGDIAQAHTEDEFIDLTALETGAAILARFLDDYGVTG